VMSTGIKSSMSRRALSAICSRRKSRKNMRVRSNIR
jgi:hypothetical protein